jgi:hypothetical protein
MLLCAKCCSIEVRMQSGIQEMQFSLSLCVCVCARARVCLCMNAHMRIRNVSGSLVHNLSMGGAGCGEGQGSRQRSCVCAFTMMRYFPLMQGVQHGVSVPGKGVGFSVTRA